MNDIKTYDCAIIGGGLAGLCLSIQLAKQGHRVILFEKEQYPFHKVCGEYISFESHDFLIRLGLPLDKMQLPVIKKLIVSSPSGSILAKELPLGGFGISRYKIDNDLKDIAVELGVTVMENCKAEDIRFTDGLFSILTTKGGFTSKVCCAGFGKRSNLDVKWKRGFTQQPANKLNNYIAVKYHIRFDFAADSIALHNFKDGYCGISRIEDGKYCLCYLTNAANLKNSGNSIDEMEKKILSRNPHLKNIFDHCKRLYDQPLSISQISFQEKTTVGDHVLFIGDAAGMITPLCGNGMSMAMHGSKIAATFVDSFLQGRLDRDEMEHQYSTAWKKAFEKRLLAGRVIQRFFGKERATEFFLSVMKRFPRLTKWLISKTHGSPF